MFSSDHICQLFSSIMQNKSVLFKTVLRVRTPSLWCTMHWRRCRRWWQNCNKK